MTKETLSRLLRNFMDQGLIAVAKREVKLPRPGEAVSARARGHQARFLRSSRFGQRRRAG
jgi:hypothetical protein